MSPVSYNIDYSQIMSSFDHYRQEASFIEENLQHETWQITFDVFDYSQYLL